jgi:hypothetical protein
MIKRTDPVLSPREQQVLELMRLGFSELGIASRLQISTHTVNTHMGHVSTKLGLCTAVPGVNLRYILVLWWHNVQALGETFRTTNGYTGNRFPRVEAVLPWTVDYLTPTVV